MKNRSGYNSKYLRENHADKNLNTLKNRFYSKIQINIDNDCLEWIGTKNEKGYGLIYINNTNIKAHRFSYELHFHKIQKGKEIMHSCDNPSCVNPLHLKIATHKENMIDCKNKNRNYKISPRNGEKNNKAKLKINDVIKIRKLLSNNYKKNYIAKKYNVTPENIRSIELNKTWRNI